MSQPAALYVLHGAMRAPGPQTPLEGALPGTQLLAIPAGALVAIATPIPPGLLSIAPEAIFEDADFAASAALAHNRILAAIAERQDVVPIALGAAARSAEEAGALVRARAPALEGALARIEGCVEYVARIIAPEGAPRGSEPTPVEPEAESGRSYLARRRAGVEARRTLMTRIDALCDEAEKRLAAHARATVRSGHTPGALGPRRLLDLALLVERGRVGALIEEGAHVFETARSQGLAFDISGPWPAYSFAAEPQSAAA